jgi:uncharacterized metal-binding protein
MTVEQREAGIIRDKIDFHFLEAANHDNILDDAGCRLPCHTRQFETAAVQVAYSTTIPMPGLLPPRHRHR